MQAINGAAVLLVLFSKSSNDSEHVAREVERAVSKKVRVLPLRLDAIAPCGSLEYLLSTTQWLDASRKPTEAQLAALDQALGAMAPRGHAEVRPPAPHRPALRRGWMALTAAALAVAALAAAVLAVRTPTVAALDKSIAVLPLANMSSEKDSQYFSDGMHDEILTALAKIRDLKVIARTSVEKYRDRHDDIRAIARELEVFSVMEGSVQRDGNRVRINVQLIDARSGAHLWAERYDRELTDVFAVQSEIAHEVTRALKATLLPAEASVLAVAPTRNDKAYDLYLQAASLQRRIDNEPSLVARLSPEWIGLLQQAIREDPDFALAHATLAIAHMQTYWYVFDVTAERLAAAKAAADRALSLQPDSGEAEVALGLYANWGHGDYAAATKHFDRALRILPNDARAVAWQALVLRRQGRFEEALKGYLHAAALDPQSPKSWGELANAYWMLGRVTDCLAASDRAIAVSGNTLNTRVDRAIYSIQIDGNLQPLRNAIGTIQPGSDEFLDQAQNIYTLHWYSRDFAAAARVTEAMPKQFGTDALQLFVTLAAAHAYNLGGQKELARQRYTSAAALIDAQLKEEPDKAYLWSSRAYALAGLGRNAEALAAAQRATEIVPVSKDTVDGLWHAHNLARIHAWVGNPDRALELLEQLRGPGGGFGPGELRLDPFFDRLRGNPRFEALLRS